MPADPDHPSDATLLLNAAGRGDKDAADRLLPLVYDQLRKAAQRDLADKRAGSTLSATVLVHEAYLKLVGGREVPWANRAHFYTAAAEAMRQILLDHARAAHRVKRGGGRTVQSLTDVAALASGDSDQIVRFDDAFRRLETESPDAAAVVRLRFYSGQSVEHTAAALGVSTSSVDRRWAFARAWLYRRLRDES